MRRRTPPMTGNVKVDAFLAQTRFMADAEAVADLARERDQACAEVERLRAAQPACTCDRNPATTGGPEEDCEAHGESRSELIRQREGLRAAQLALPDMPAVLNVKREGEYVVVDLGHNCGAYETRESAADMAALGLAALTLFDAEAAAVDTTPDTSSRCTFCGGAGNGHQHTTPDTSRVSFGARHKGTGMVLLEHADAPREWWGCEDAHDAAYHGRWAQIADRYRDTRAAHAALAEVREALDTAEAAGVDVDDDGDASCGRGGAREDDSGLPADFRARRYLAREVQALVDQGLRGDDLNARVLYTVRDHRAPVDYIPRHRA